VVVDYLRSLRQKRVPAVIGAYALVMVLFSGAVGLIGGGQAGAESPPPPVAVTETAVAGDELVNNGLTDEEIYLIARVIEGEAANEPFKGKVAIGAVILNRVQHDNFPDSVREVVFQPRAFCVVTNGLINRPPTEDSLQAARAAVSGEDPTGGALYFWNPRKNPNPWVWGRIQLITIGNHIFAR